MTQRSLILGFLVLAFASGCSDEQKPTVEIHARGNVDVFGRAGETTLTASYSSTLGDESCEVLDETSGCALTRCTVDEAAPFEDAGEVVVSGDALDIAKDSSYSLVLPEDLVPGEVLELSASGSSVVPKHGARVTVPERTVVTAPDPAAPLVLGRTIDLEVTFDPVDSDRVVLSLAFDDLAISCAVSGLDGRLSVASRLVRVLPADVVGAFSVVNENLSESSVSGWRIWFGAHHVVAEGTAELAPSP